jgi:hypothetical protein
MMRSAPTFTYDVAISSIPHDARVLDGVTTRLRALLSMSSSAGRLWTPSLGEVPGPDDDAPGRVLECDARVVVVLHQRLWGRTSATQRDAEAIRRRLERSSGDGLVVISHDGSPTPEWLGPASASIRVDADLDACAEMIASMVREHGGATVTAMADDRAARATAAEREARESDSDLGSYRASSALDRELERLSEEIARRISRLGAERADLAPEVDRAPGRCTVQVGPVALSLSWIRSRPDSVASGRLMIIEWEGTIGRRASKSGPRPRALREETLRAIATRAEDWHWCSEDAEAQTYGTRELAARCVASLECALSERER